MKKIIITALTLVALCGWVQATTFDLAADYSTTNNPNGAWTYTGYHSPVPDDFIFTPLTWSGTGWKADGGDIIWKNDTGSAIGNTAPGQVALEPTAAIRWTAPATTGRASILIEGEFSEGVAGLEIRRDDGLFLSVTNTSSFSMKMMVESGEGVDFLSIRSGSLPLNLTITTLKENLALTTLDDCDGEYTSWAWEAVPGETWSGLKQVYDTPTNSAMTGGDYMYYRKASYRDLPFSVTTNTHMSIQYFSKLGPKYRSDSSGVSGIALSNHSFTNDGARFIEFRMRAHAPTSDLAELLMFDGEGSQTLSIHSPEINTWVEFRLDIDWSYMGADGKYGLCTVFMKQEGATYWQLLKDLSHIELKVDDPSEITKIGGIGHCSWSSYNGYYGFQPFLDDIRYCSGENANLGAGTNLLLDARFNEVQTPWRRDGQGRPYVPSMHTNNEPFHDGVYLICRSSYTAEVYQVINLLNQGFTAENIDAGIYRAVFGGWQFGGNGSAGQIEIEYLDINEQPISTNSLPVVTNTFGAWIEQMATNMIPPSTRSIRYRTDLSSYARLDDAHLSVLGIPQEDVALTVASIHGSPTPAIGTTSNSWGTVVNCSVANMDDGQTQYECIGWTGTGSVPASGASNSVEVTLTENSSITWNWQTNYYLDITVSGSGSVDVIDGFYAKASEQILTATPDAGWLFMGWSGDASGTNEAFVIMDAPKVVTATFSDDADGDGLTNTEEAGVGSNPWKKDTDNDGFGDKLEVDNGGNPTVSDKWRVDHIRANGGDFDLYSSNSVLNVAVGEMLFEVVGNQATLNLQLEESDDLATWTNAGPAKVWTWTVDGQKKFFRVRSGQ